MRRAVITTLLLVPVGAAIGFLSSAVIAAGYDVISTTFREVIYSDSERANNAIGITLVALLGGAAGAILTPAIYVVGFTQLSTRRLAGSFSLIALATVVLGLLGAFLGPNATLFMTVVGFVGACATAYAYVMDQREKRSS